MGKQSVQTRDVIRLLERLGLSCSAGEAYYLLRREPETRGEKPLVIPLARSREQQPIVVAYVRRQLDEAGLLAWEDFERKIAQG
jgi:hypothetical protein